MANSLLSMAAALAALLLVTPRETLAQSSSGVEAPAAAAAPGYLGPAAPAAPVLPETAPAAAGLELAPAGHESAAEATVSPSARVEALVNQLKQATPAPGTERASQASKAQEQQAPPGGEPAPQPVYVPGAISQPAPRPLGIVTEQSALAGPPAATGQPIRLPIGLAVGQPLAFFGYDFFSRGPQPPYEASQMPIPDDYVLGPGDGLSVHVWNKFQDQLLPVEINRDGRLTLPHAGEIFVMGLKYAQLSGVLQREVAKYLQDAHLTVNLVKLRSFQVFVTGEVKEPGMVAVNAVNTAINALLAAGGPTFRGSLRRVVLRRGKKDLAAIDYYSLLLRGRLDTDPALQPGDILFVPVIGRTAAATGMVKREAIFELQSGDTLGDLIDYAGGLTASAYEQRLVLFRNREGSFREIKDLKTHGDWRAVAKSVSLHDGDVLNVPQITTSVFNSVTLRGNVERPGQYEFKRGMRVKDLVALGRTVLPDTLMDRAEILRVKSTPAKMPYNTGVDVETIRELVAVDLGKALRCDPVSNIKLRPGDDLTVLQLRAGGPVPQVSIQGEVVKPGNYELASGMRVRDLVYLAGNVKLDAHLTHAELVRHRLEGGETILPINLALALEGADSDNRLLENMDSLQIHADARLVEKVQVTVSGEVRYAGSYQMHKGDRLSDLIRRAGGFTELAFLPGAEFARASVRKRQEEEKKRFVEEQRRIIAGERAKAQRLPTTAQPIGNPQTMLGEAEQLIDKLDQTPAGGRVSINLGAPMVIAPGRGAPVALAVDEDILLEDGDALSIPRPPSEIGVAGEVFTPSSFAYKPNLQVADYISAAGGMTARAWRGQAFLVRANGSAVSAAQNIGRGSAWDGVHMGEPTAPHTFFLTPVRRGDSIFVPSDYRVKRDRTAEILDSTYKLALSIGAMAVVFH